MIGQSALSNCPSHSPGLLRIDVSWRSFCTDTLPCLYLWPRVTYISNWTHHFFAAPSPRLCKSECLSMRAYTTPIILYYLWGVRCCVEDVWPNYTFHYLIFLLYWRFFIRRQVCTFYCPRFSQGRPILCYSYIPIDWFQFSLFISPIIFKLPFIQHWCVALTVIDNLSIIFNH